MKIKVMLWKAQPKKDGTCPIKVYLHAGKPKYYSLGISCLPKDFDDKAGRVKRTRANWAEMNSIIAQAQGQLEGLMLTHRNVSADQIIKLYEGESVESTGKLIPFIDHFISECEDGKIKRAINTIKKYRTTVNHLKKYNPDLKFTDINKNFYDTFTAYLRNDLDQKENSVGGIIKNIKVFLNEANERGVSNIIEHKKKYFKTISEETDSIYLTEDELNKLINLDLSAHPAHAEERDRFICATFLLLRWSDSIRVGKSNFTEQTVNKKRVTIFRQRNQKTEIEVVMPVKPIVKEIFERNHYCIHFTGKNSKANARLKELGKMAKFNEEVFLNGRNFKKWELITTHTARRSGATNYWLAGIDSKTLMNFGGWKQESTMFRYIKITKLQSALSLANHPVFR